MNDYFVICIYMLATHIQSNYKNLKWWKTLEAISYRHNHLIDATAQKRLKILLFWEAHWIEATLDAFGMSERTLYNWKAKYTKGGKSIHSLSEKKRTPKRRRKREWDYRVYEQIETLREQYPNLWKSKIYPLLEEYCIWKDIEYPWVSTIGRIIQDMWGLRKQVWKRKNKVRQKVLRKPSTLKARFPWDVIALDTVEVRIESVKRYVVTVIDIYSRTSHALVTSSHSSRTAMSVLQEFEHKFGMNIKNVLTDNGSEFALNFRKYVEKQKITHYHTYPSSPKMNAHCERFNRTIREGVLNINKYKLQDLQQANKLVGEFLDFYNNKRVHFAFENKMTPLQKRIQYDTIHSITAI